MSFSSRAVGVSLSVLASCLLPLAASAQAPQLINYQGRLLSGTNLVNGNVGLSLRLFDASAAGTLLYEDSNTVTVADGLYSTFLGDNPTFGAMPAALENTNVWMEVAVNGAALSPRERLASAAYAVKAQQAQVFTGSVLDSQLTANIARLNGANQTFTGPVNFTSAGNTFRGTFSGNGAEMSNVSVALSAVTIPSSQPNVLAWGSNVSGQTNVPANAAGVVAIAGGAGVSMALRSDGTVVAWGSGGSGQTNVPANATGVVAIAAGGIHSLALRNDGTVVAWGGGFYGQTNIPANATGVVAIAAGDYHSLALRRDGTVLAWGAGTSVGSFPDYGQSIVPAGATDVVAIAAGGSCSLALRADGTVLAWGRPDFGQTGVPAAATGVVAVAAGSDHSLALRNDGTVIAWGLGAATNVPAIATGVVAIAGGGNCSLALRNDGTVIAWGLGAATNVPAIATGVVAIAAGGSHGLALRDLRMPAPLARLDVATNSFAGTVAAASFAGSGAGLTGISGASLAPNLATNLAYLNGANQTFSGPVQFSSVANTFRGTFSGNGAGVSNVSVALSSVTVAPLQPNVLAWGSNVSGQTNVPANATGVVDLAAGGIHSLALRNDGTVVAWGAGSYGQTNIPANATGVVAIAAGDYHSLALRRDGTVLAWGAGTSVGPFPDYGQSIVPAGATDVVAIAAGSLHSLALRVDGTVLAWGRSDFGQTSVPAEATGVVALAGGGTCSLALRGDGSVIAWGVGAATNVPASATGVVAIAGGAGVSMALRSDGTVVAWGSGGGTNLPAGATGVIAIAAGGSHGLALLNDGTVIAWGSGVGTNLPAGATGVIAIAAGNSHGLALLNPRPPAPLARLDVATNSFAGTVVASSFAGNGAGLTGLSGASLIGGTISNVTLAAEVLTNIAARADSNLVWSTFATVAGLAAEQNARIGSDAALSNSVAALGTNVSVRADSNLVWSTFATAAGLTAEQNARLGSDAALSNSVATLGTNVSARADSNLVWNTFATAAGLTAEQNARLGSGAALSNSVAALATNVSARADSNLVWSTFATAAGLTAEQSARIGSGAALSNSVAALATNVSARLDSNVWAATASTTNYVRRTGDTMSGALQVIGTNPFPHVRVSAASTAPYGAFLSIDASATTNGKNYLIYATGSSAGEGAGKLCIQNFSDGVIAMTMASNGYVGIGTTTPTTRLHIKQAFDNSGFNPANDGLRIEAASGEFWGIQTQSSGDLVFDSGFGTGYAYISKNQGTFNVTSDARFKKDVEPLAGTLDRVLQLRPVTFRYNAAPEDSKPVTGFLAQDVLPLFPDVVDEKDGHYAINYGGFGPIAIGAIQELKKESDAKIAELEAQLRAVLERLQALEENRGNVK